MKNKKLNDKQLEVAENIKVGFAFVTVLCLLTISIGLVVSIWLGFVGLKIVGTGIVISIPSQIGFHCIDGIISEEKENEKNN